MTLRISLLGRVSIGSGSLLLEEDRLPGRQGRLVFAYLVIEQGRPVTRDELAEALWGQTPPATWEKALGVIASKLRALLGECGVDGARVLTSAFGCYRLELPEGSWVDVVAVEHEVDAAEASLAADQPERAMIEARHGVSLARPPLLPGEDGAWVEERRRRLSDVLERALCCLADACLRSGAYAEAAKWAQEAIDLEPYRESGYRRLMRAHAAAGNGAEALQAYERCRRLLDEELGAYPSAETESIYRELLKTAPAGERAAADVTLVAPVVATLGGQPSAASDPDSRPMRPAIRGAKVGGEDPRDDEMQSRRPGRRAVVVTLLILAAAFAGVGGLGWWILQPSAAGLPPGSWTIGLEMPLTGEAADLAAPVRHAVQLAIDDTNAAGGILGSRLTLQVYDDGGSNPKRYRFGQSPRKGARNARAMVADPRTIAMVGPWGSSVGVEVLPVTNKGGLFECSPANTSPALTKPRYGALDLRSAYPERINYVRLAPADDIPAPALAAYAVRDLGAKTALVIDDMDVFGRGLADGFQQAFEKMGGRVTRRALNPGADLRRILVGWAGEHGPGVVFFGGQTESGGVNLRLAMIKAGLGSVPFLSGDGLLDGSGANQDSFIARVGRGASGSFVAHASVPPSQASFSDAYRAAFGAEPDEYAGAAYGCVQVIVASLLAIAARAPSAGSLRQALRAYAVDPKHRYETVVGTVGFDANGDSTQQFVTFYHVDPTAADGRGDWVIDKQQDYGPAP